MKSPIKTVKKSYVSIIHEDVRNEVSNCMSEENKQLEVRLRKDLDNISSQQLNNQYCQKQ